MLERRKGRLEREREREERKSEEAKVVSKVERK